VNDSIAKVVESLKTKVSELNFNNWIRPATFTSPSSGLLKIGVPNKFIRDWIGENYLNLIKYELFKVTGVEHEVVFEISQDEGNLSSFARPPVLKPTVETSKNSDLFTPKYTFDTFVVGSSNQFAHAASMAVAEVRPRPITPLYLWGSA
jgi:chromosomal replication initiator protein